MTYRQIESLRQIRLFITQVAIPAGVGLVAIDKMHPEWKYKIADKCKVTKADIQNKWNARKFKEVQDDSTTTSC